MISFRVVPYNSDQTKQVVEILCDGEVCAVLYPSSVDAKAVRLISAHMTNVLHNDGRGSKPPIPEVVIHFQPEPYTIQHGTIIRGRR